jgi:hypothetical protein
LTNLSDAFSAILQRVLSASVTVDKQLISSVGKGILVFAAVAPGDTEKDAEALASKVLKMRLWDEENGGRVGTDFPYTYFCKILIVDSGNKAFKISMEKFFVVSNDCCW